ncbi:MAG TPA: endonuclease/exonuclease/phosphatase family protein [Gemmatimonadaceae bacterium]|nr:endonuclease/exonuclease/phosphatase family protein [Gemmatimonadaceae bacterium]
MRWPTACLCFLLVLLGSCARAHGGSDQSIELRVLVFNIFAGKDTTGARNLERVAALVRETGADLVLLQEVDRRTRRSGGVDQPAVLASLTGYAAAFGRTLDYQDGEYGIALLSRWPIARDTMVALPVSPAQERAGGSREPRGALMALIDAPSVVLAVVNTHLDASGDERYRLQELATLLPAAERQGSAAGGLLVGGDFNARPGSEVIRRVLANGWRDAWTECGGADPGYTFPAHAPDRRIDYLFLAADETCSEARVVSEGISDHRALLVTVRITAPAGTRPSTR